MRGGEEMGVARVVQGWAAVCAQTWLLNTINTIKGIATKTKTTAAAEATAAKATIIMQVVIAAVCCWP